MTKKVLAGIDSASTINATGDLSTSGTLFVNASAGDEGGEIRLAVPQTNTTINGTVNIDVYQNKLRIWEGSGTNRGYYLDMSTAAAGVGSNLSANIQGAMNYEQQQSTKQSGISASGVTIVSRSFTTHGYPVQVLVTGDAENSTAGGWVKLQLYRDTTPIGKIVHVEMSAASENVPYALTVIDTPGAGTYTYSLKTVSVVSTGTMNFGETDGPVLTMIELATPMSQTVMPMFITRKTATQVITGNGTNTIVNFSSSGSTPVNRGGFTMSAGTVTVPVSGYYRIRGTAYWDAAVTTGNNKVVLIYINGSAASRVNAYGGLTYDFISETCVEHVYLAAGDTVRLNVYQSSPSNVNLLSGGSDTNFQYGTSLYIEYKGN